MVDGRLAAHRRIHLGQQGRGHLQEAHAAHVHGGRKARHVADDSAAQGHQDAAAVQAVGQQGIEDQVQRLPVLVGFAVGQFDAQHPLAAARQRGFGALAVQGRHRRVGHDRDRGRIRGYALVQGIQAAWADMDRIAPARSIDVNNVHMRFSKACNCGSSALTRVWIGIEPVSTTRSATSL
ncbi:hypothetical protein D3C86_1534140 [compost metagenome]